MNRLSHTIYMYHYSRYTVPMIACKSNVIGPHLLQLYNLSLHYLKQFIIVARTPENILEVFLLNKKKTYIESSAQIGPSLPLPASLLPCHQVLDCLIVAQQVL